MKKRRQQKQRKATFLYFFLVINSVFFWCLDNPVWITFRYDAKYARQNLFFLFKMIARISGRTDHQTDQGTDRLTSSSMVVCWQVLEWSFLYIPCWDSPGRRMSSILRIILTSWVAREICCFFAISVSITFWAFMSFVPFFKQSMPKRGLFSLTCKEDCRGRL